MLELTRKGRNVLGMSSGESDRHGGAEHRYWCKVLADRLRAQRYAVTEEAPIGGGKTIDLLAERGGKRIAFEIETGKSDAAAEVPGGANGQRRRCSDLSSCQSPPVEEDTRRPSGQVRNRW